MIGKLINFAKDMYDQPLSITIRGEKLPIGKSDLEILLFKATSSEHYMLNNEEIYEIIDKTYSSFDCDTIMNHIWDRLSLPSEEWRKIFKVRLTLLIS